MSRQNDIVSGDKAIQRKHIGALLALEEYRNSRIIKPTIHHPKSIDKRSQRD